jgi:5'-3' exonuclease
MSTLLVDGNNLLLYCAHKVRDLSPLSVLISFVVHLGKVLDGVKASKATVAWDTGIDPARRALYPEYKAHRARQRDPGQAKDAAQHMRLMADAARRAAAFAELPLLKALLPMLGIGQVWGDGPAEGDDLIYHLLNAQPPGQPLPTVLLSNDGDLYQLLRKGWPNLLPPAAEGGPLNNPYAFPVYLLKPGDIYAGAGSTGSMLLRMVSCLDVEGQFGWQMEHHVLAKALIGDSSDNLPGVRGLGIKTVPLLLDWAIRGCTSASAEADSGMVFRYIFDHVEEAVAALPRHRGKHLPGSEALVQRNMDMIWLRNPSVPVYSQSPVRVGGMDDCCEARVFMDALKQAYSITLEGQLDRDDFLSPFYETGNRALRLAS